MVAGRELNPAYQHKQYLFRRKFLRIFGGAFHTYDESGNLVFYTDQKRFRVKEDFRIYSDESKNTELMRIKTPQIFDVWANYNVIDSSSGEEVGQLRRKAMMSIIKDEWEIKAADGRVIGKLTESSILGALLSRWWNLIPQKYTISTSEGREVARIKQHFNPIILKYTMEILEAAPAIDPRLLIAAGILLAAIERRQTEILDED
jgi:uncharacterized protein YxjI